MEERKGKLKEELMKLEASMTEANFWSDKDQAQATIRRIQELKSEIEGVNKYDKSNAIVTIISGAGGDDAEDFSGMLFGMYDKYVRRKGWEISFIHMNRNDHGGYRNISFEVKGKNVYGNLKNESGVHRLVRISPFNAKKLRHTSFSLVEVLPKFSKLEEKDIVFLPEDLKIEFARSSGPGGQNVNKRETAVRIVHTSTGISVHASGKRSQEQNREQALAILRAKIFKKAIEEKKSIEESMKLKNMEIEWGSQIRSYVLHPYKMVKDHRTGMETSDVYKVLNEGEIDIFIEAERDL